MRHAALDCQLQCPIPPCPGRRARVTSCVKKVRLMSAVVCALYLKIHDVRGISSYVGIALRARAGGSSSRTRQ